MSADIAKADPQRKPAIACGCLIAAAIVLVAVGRHGRQPEAIDTGMAARAVELRFTDLPDGTVVAAAASGDEIERIAPGAGGFIRVTMRSFATERRSRGFDAQTPFTLMRMSDGDLVLHDRTTGRTMLLDAFGPANEGAFAELLDHGRTTQ